MNSRELIKQLEDNGWQLRAAFENAREAIDLWCETVIQDGGEIPVTHSLAHHQADPEFAGWVWAVIEVPVERYMGPAEKINITLPRMLLNRINTYTKAHGISRSSFLAQAAQQAMRAE